MMWRFSEATSVLPPLSFLIFLGIECSVLHDGSIHSFPSFQVAENIIHMLRCLASYRIQWDLRACFISTYMAQEHTTAQLADVRI